MVFSFSKVNGREATNAQSMYKLTGKAEGWDSHGIVSVDAELNT